MSSGYYIRTMRAGRMVKTVRYRRPMPNDTGRTRSERMAHTRAAQRFINCKNCADKLELLLWANFDSKEACFVTLTYRDNAMPGTRETAKNAVRRFFTAMRDEKRRSGGELKYIYNTEGTPHNTGQNATGEWEVRPWNVPEQWNEIIESGCEVAETRLHHHAVMSLSKADFEAVRAFWPYGYVSIAPIKVNDVGTFQRLAYYMTKEYRAGKTGNGERAYTPSLNLKKPELSGKWVEEYEDVSAPTGATIIRNTTDETAYSSYHQLCYILPRSTPQPTEYQRRQRKRSAIAPIVPGRGGRLGR